MTLPRFVEPQRELFKACRRLYAHLETCGMPLLVERADGSGRDHIEFAKLLWNVAAWTGQADPTLLPLSDFRFSEPESPVAGTAKPT